MTSLRAFYGSSLVLLLALEACGSDDSSSASGGSTKGATCPDVAGSWKITAHCDPSLVGQTATATQSGCNMTFAAPFDGFSGSVTTTGNVSLSGPQSCSGTATTSAITMNCTPGTCAVTLSR